MGTAERLPRLRTNDSCVISARRKRSRKNASGRYADGRTRAGAEANCVGASGGEPRQAADKQAPAATASQTHGGLGQLLGHGGSARLEGPALLRRAGPFDKARHHGARPRLLRWQFHLSRRAILLATRR